MKYVKLTAVGDSESDAGPVIVNLDAVHAVVPVKEGGYDDCLLFLPDGKYRVRASFESISAMLDIPSGYVQ